MKNMQQHLTEKLNNSLSPVYLEVSNESDQHAGPASESHFKLVVVSDDFKGLKLIDRHRLINQLFSEEMGHIHALAMHTYTPSEWQMRSSAPDSPKCASGNK